MAKKKKKKSKFGFLIRFLIKTALIVLAVWAVITYAVTPVRQTGNGMYPNAKDGDLCLFYQLEDAGKGEVVLYVDENGTQREGRIVAVGGETIDFPENGGYTVNGIEASEEIVYETYKETSSTIQYPLTLADDEFFVLNDFRSDTTDSRSYGPVKASNIKGKLIFVLRRRNF